MTAKAWAGKAVNSTLRPLGVQVISGRSTNPNNPAVKTFIPAQKTLTAAKQSGLSVGDYIDKTFAEPGVTAATVKEMLDLSGLQSQVSRVCEIGPGSGRYMEKVVECLHPDAYEIYETADDWLPYLRTFPTALVRPCDGRTLSSTATASVDLVHAQKVFVYLDFWTTANYFDEMARVVRPGGTVAFDVVTEDCLDEAASSTRWSTDPFTGLSRAPGLLIFSLVAGSPTSATTSQCCHRARRNSWCSVASAAKITVVTEQPGPPELAAFAWKNREWLRA